jgi:hypothetical protein
MLWRRVGTAYGDRCGIGVVIRLTLGGSDPRRSGRGEVKPSSAHMIGRQVRRAVVGAGVKWGFAGGMRSNPGGRLG